MHLLAERHILAGLKEGGWLQGEVEDMMEQRIAALFMPHGRATPACLTFLVILVAHSGACPACLTSVLVVLPHSRLTLHAVWLATAACITSVAVSTQHDWLLLHASYLK